MPKPPYRIQFYEDISLHSGSNAVERHPKEFSKQEEAEEEATIQMVSVSRRLGEAAGYVIIDGTDTVIKISRT